jgi:DNA-binding LacI/PurR family transcriptional regulator
MVARAVRHLRGQGCRRIAMLSWGHDGLRPALRDVLDRCGLSYRPAWVRGDLHPMLSGAGWEEFREIWTAHREKPDGLLVTDDVLFEEVCVAIRELGIRVPDELRIVTHANKGANRRYPFPVTLAQRDTRRYAEALGETLLKRMRGEPVVPAIAAFPFEMVESDAAPAASNEAAGVAAVSDARVTAETTP